MEALDWDAVERERQDALCEGVYLDYAASGVCTRRQLQEAFRTLESHHLANPHSAHAASVRASMASEGARRQVLEFFGAAGGEWDVVFVQGATGGLRLLAQEFSWGEGAALIHEAHCHTSLLGMREVCTARGGEVVPLPHSAVCAGALDQGVAPGREAWARCMVAVPGECNFSGYNHCPAPLARLRTEAAARCSGGDTGVFFVLDAAKWASTSPVDLSALPFVDAVTVSFYKLFGYPTGVGALVVRRAAADTFLARGPGRYFGGGTIASATAMEPGSVEARPSVHERLEDGTLPYMELAALPAGFAQLQRLGGMAAIELRTSHLARWTAAALSELRHGTGRRVVRLLGRQWDAAGASTGEEGSVVAFAVEDAAGGHVGHGTVVESASSVGVALRGGCFCNLGACHALLGLSRDAVARQRRAGHVCGDEVGVVDGLPTGAVRASFGPYSTREDAKALVAFVRDTFRCETAATEKEEGGRAPTEAGDGSGPHLRVRDLYVYPVKSCGGLRVRRWPVSGRGLLLDRTWAVRRADGAVLRQKDCPALRHTRCHLEPRPGGPSHQVVLTHPEAVEALVLTVPARVDEELVHAGAAAVAATDGRDAVVARTADADAWFSALAGAPCAVDDVEDAVQGRSLANQAPVLMVNAASVEAAQQWLGASGSVSALSFRPNVVVEGEEAFAEDAWASVEVATASGPVKLDVEGRCARCTMVNYDPAAGEASGRTLAVLARHRREGHHIYFGTLLTPVLGEGGMCTLGVGAVVGTA